MKMPGHSEFLIADWRVAPAQGVLTRGHEVVRLEPKAMDVLVYLASRPGEVVTREELERDVWRGALVGYDAVTNTVIKLRKALQDDARKPRFLATIPKKGYQLIASITDPEDAGAPGSLANGVPETLPRPWRRWPAWTAGRTGTFIAALAVIVVLGLMSLWIVDRNHGGEPPSIVVLPFENLSADAMQDYLADGITEDIITDLSKLSKILVIASSTSSTFKGKRVPSKQIGTDLNVQYVLRGSIQRLGDKVRVTAQLFDTNTGITTWAQRYDRTVAQVFAVQDEVTRSIVEALAVKITNQEESLLAQRATSDLRAYDYFQEGQRLFNFSTREYSEQAREAYRKAIELDPGYGRAYGAIAVTLAFDYRRGWTDTPNETLDRGLELAKKAVALDHGSPQIYFALGFVHLARKEFVDAEKAAARSLEIAPNYADGYGLLALISNSIGQPRRAMALVTKGMRLNPYFTWQYLYVLGTAYYMLGDYDAAITTLEEAQSRNENVVQTKQLLAASYVNAGRQDDAEWVVDRLRILSPTATLTEIERHLPIERPEQMRALLDDLRKAGLPE